ncbi:efflux RND transporter periplasmic adaptor subunit [Cohnella lupini]|uniref:RND family efflux transporter MFP subunit n=1 Tax=Cohnella lupini TaxID=1294267 RepID=A0A3D9IBQ7_9BACL|nr:HlyD family efflux transporter periplasmic adaptor subunit [Cohnella lupini]RED59214.1 RND family efflux transporter MFP subunit [Cohnella lupini]
MKVESTQPMQDKKKRKIRLIAVLFIALLVICTLLGNTLQALTLPKVATIQSSKGALVHSYQGSATVRSEMERDLLNPMNWIVEKLPVQVGDKVEKGQTLVEYDDRSAVQQLADEQSALQKLELSMKQLEQQYIQAMQTEDEMAKSSASSAIELAKIDIATQKSHIQIGMGELEEHRRIVAPFAGIVTDVNAVVGLASSGEPDIRLANASAGFRIDLQIPADVAALMKEGEDLDVLLSGEKTRILAGKVASIEAGDGPPVDEDSDSMGGNQTAVATEKLTVSLQDKSLQGGERVKVQILKSNPEEEILLSNQVILEDNEGSYVFTLEERQGPLGNAYYAVRTPIKKSDSNGSMTAVSEGLFEEQQIIVVGDHAIMDGTRVRL